MKGEVLDIIGAAVGANVEKSPHLPYVNGQLSSASGILHLELVYLRPTHLQLFASSLVNYPEVMRKDS